MTAGDLATLWRYRLRPLEPATLAIALGVSLAAGIVMIPGGSEGAEVPPTGSVTAPLTILAMALASTVAFVAGRDVDVAEALLTSTPRPYRRALVLRVVLWAVVLAALAAFTGARAGDALQAPPHVFTTQALVYVLFAGSLALVLSRSLGSLAGGGAALAAIAVLAGLPLAFESFPVTLLATGGSPEWTTTAPRLELLSATLLATAFWRARP